MDKKKFEERLHELGRTEVFHPVVPVSNVDQFLAMDFTASNMELTGEIISNTDLFSRYINSKLGAGHYRYGIGGYNEHRTVYSRSKVFDTMEGEPRRLHLGLDIWGSPYTKVMAPMDGIVHSFAFNNAFGDYGATIILSHNIDGLSLYTLYGHLSLNDLKNIQEGDRVRRGDVFASFGIPFENGQWPPHLHFQLIRDIKSMKGDYLGVCRLSEAPEYLDNSPDPMVLFPLGGYQFSS